MKFLGNLHATSKGSDQTGHICRLVRAFAGLIYHIVRNLSCCSSFMHALR